jgi:SAM-dependent methyltransferase
MTIDRPLIRPELLAILACPTCEAGKLRLSTPADGQPSLRCEGCDAEYGFAYGMPLLHTRDSSWAPKAREAEGWVAMWKDIGIYELDLPVSVLLPFDAIDEPWLTMKRMFTSALFQMDLRGGEWVLDIGAGEGWASQQFAMRGANAVAIDVVGDPKFGLGRSYKRMAISKVPFDLIVGDNERLPFQANSFDVVFASNALHHHDHLDALFSNIYRVLKPGGRLVAMGDPLTTIFQRESDATDGDREKSFGIIERRRHFHDYLLAVWQAGFRNLHAEDSRTCGLSNAELYPWMDRARREIEADAPHLLRPIVRLITWAMLRLPRPFALALMLSLYRQSNLMISGQKRG